ncbi:ABC transporter permease [Tomitella gaofuii]|uniref:ABC transporter permease n=1 Tax=Tomitella gaofuii TaxID=2760083 RepID=UPI0015FB3A3A|nr:ABC transporter permease [Tomitella gaofuii]
MSPRHTASRTLTKPAKNLRADPGATEPASAFAVHDDAVPASLTSQAEREALEFPELTHAWPETSLRALPRQSLLHAHRLLFGWLRDPLTTVQVLLYPGLMLVMFKVVLGNSIGAATGQSAIYGQVAMMALIASMVGSMVGAISLQLEKRSGLLSRFWVLPVHRASSLAGRLIAEAVRIIVTTAVILIVGVLLGFRFQNGFWPAVGMFFIPLLFGLAFATMVTAAAVVGGQTKLIEMISLVTSLLMFFNTGFVPLMAYPQWLQTFVEYQPMSCAVEAMRSFALGTPLGNNLWYTLAWAVGLILLFTYPAIRGFRKAANP